MRILYLIFLVGVSCNDVHHEAAPNERVEAMYSDARRDFAEKASVTEAQPQVTKKLIKTGNIRFLSEDIEKDYERVSKILPDFDAYVENENQWKTTEEVHYDLTLRVASDQFDSLYTTIIQIGERIEHKSVHVNDVTEQFYDLEARIRNKKALEQTYLQLLEKAAKISDLVEIERSLNEVRTQIEQFEGQFKYLNKQISYSTISLSFYEKLPYTYDTAYRTGFFARILNALGNGWQGFLSFVVGVFTLWPFILLVPFVVYTFRKTRSWWRQRRAK